MVSQPAHSTRRVRSASRPKRRPKTRRKPAPDLSREPEAPENRLARDLLHFALRLKAIYGTALAVELALRKQDAESDVAFSECLRHGVCVPIADQFERAEALLKELGVKLPEPLP